jgi:predicted nucleic acid-binding protein
VGPIRRSDARLLAEFDVFFATTVGEIVPLSRDVLDRATEVRAQHGFATPDAIHLAAALVAGCDVFLTNDHRLNRAVGIQVEVV